MVTNNIKASSPTIIIIALTVFTFIFQQVYIDQSQMFMLHKGDLINAPYTLITHMFLHADFSHLFFNMFGVLMFGFLLEKRLSDVQYYALYFGSGFLAGLVGNFIYDGALGASAGVMALVGAAAYIFPKVVFYIFGVLPVQLRYLAIFYFVYDFLASFGVNNVANLAHIIGLVLGVMYAVYVSGNMTKKSIRSISRVEAHISNGSKTPPKVIVIDKNKSKQSQNTNKLSKDDFSKKMYVSIDESDSYLNKRK